MNLVLRRLLGDPLNWLLVAVPIAAVLEWREASGIWIFIASAAAIVPMAGLMGRATENLAATMGAAAGGLLNATFGNAAELIIGIMALLKGPAMYPLVRASITGSIMGNILLVLGVSSLVGGLYHSRQVFSRVAASMGATLLALASIGLLMPTVYFYLFRNGAQLTTGELHTVENLSEEIAIILAVIYILSLVFSLWTHQHLFGAGDEAEEGEGPEWGTKTSLAVLVAATAGVAWMSHLLVGTVETAGEALGLNQVFLGVIVVAIVANAAEHSTAVWMASKNKLGLSMSIAIGSGIQIALFVAPVLVFASMAMGAPKPLDLHFTPLELMSVIIAVGVLALVVQVGESHWMVGVMLLGVYVIIALAFYHLP
ncbi:MAG: calcium/proton exchanger [Aureliella sp.]|jgi:Ca2+:H+ antiporter